MEPLLSLPVEKPLPPSDRHLLARWGGTAGVVNQAAAIQGPATSQHQGLSITPHIPSSLINVFAINHNNSLFIMQNIFGQIQFFQHYVQDDSIKNSVDYSNMCNILVE